MAQQSGGPSGEDGAHPDPPAPPTPPAGTTPAGWYRDATSGRQRWWDGAAWGPFAPPTGSASAGTGLAVLAHVSLLFGALVVPLVLYVTAGSTDPFVRRHAREALNFHLTFFVGWLGLMGTVFLGAVRSIASAPDSPPVLLFLFPLAAFGFWIVGFVLAVLGAVRAGRGEEHRYPFVLRLVGRAEDRAERAERAERAVAD